MHKSISEFMGMQRINPNWQNPNIKSLALSKTIYTSTMIHPSKKFMDQLYSLQKDFISRGRPPKIKHTTLIADYVDGGYKDIDIATKLESLKIIWIIRMLDNNFHVW